MSDFKNLPLDREKIDDCIKKYFSNTAKIKQENTINGCNYTINIDNDEYRLSLYFKKYGKTTITYKTGKFDNYEKNRELAVYISRNAVYSENSQTNINYSTDKLDNDTFELILDFLKEEIGCEIIKKVLNIKI